MAGNHVVTARATVKIREEGKNMLNHLMNTRTLRLGVFAVAIAMLTAVVSVPAGAAKDKTLSKTELRNLVANAKTAADHERIAQYFDSVATKYEAESKKHEEEASYYAVHPTPATGKQQGFYSQSMQRHCPNLAAKLKEAAQEARLIAAGHREMAKEAK
jgi:hypothetical protein